MSRFYIFNDNCVQCVFLLVDLCSLSNWFNFCDILIDNVYHQFIPLRTEHVLLISFFGETEQKEKEKKKREEETDLTLIVENKSKRLDYYYASMYFTTLPKRF